MNQNTHRFSSCSVETEPGGFSSHGKVPATSHQCPQLEVQFEAFSSDSIVSYFGVAVENCYVCDPKAFFGSCDDFDEVDAYDGVREPCALFCAFNVHLVQDVPYLPAWYFGAGSVMFVVRDDYLLRDTSARLR